MPKDKEKTILQESNDIIFKRKEEKEREYGPINNSIADTATIASIMTNKTITTSDVYKVLIALKISRLRHNNKHDTYLDAIGYLAADEAYQRVLDSPLMKEISEHKFKIEDEQNK